MSCSNTQSFQITINTPPFSITTGSLPNICNGVAYSELVEVTNGVPPYTWSVSLGSLPPGFSLNTSTGEISGTSTTSGSYNFTITVTDSAGPPNSVSQAYTIEIYSLPVITTNILQSGVNGTPYSEFLAGSGNSPFTWTLTAGALPDGLVLNNSTGEISGTPTVNNTFIFTIQLESDDGCITTKELQIIVTNAILAIDPYTLPDVCQYSIYHGGFTATGGTPPYTWAIASGSLPYNLVLQTDGTISGVVSQAGVFTIEVAVTDADNVSTTETFSFEVFETPKITTTGLPGGLYNQIYTAIIEYTGGTNVIMSLLGTLPDGLVFESNHNRIVGTPTSFGSFPVTIKVLSDTGCSSEKNFILVIYGPPEIHPHPLKNGCQNQPYSDYVLVTGGFPPYYWFLHNVDQPLPAGFVLNPYTGEISGETSETGIFIFSIRVQDSNGLTGTRTFSVIIRPEGECSGQGPGVERRARLLSLLSDPITVMDPLHQTYLPDYFPTPFFNNKK